MHGNWRKLLLLLWNAVPKSTGFRPEIILTAILLTVGRADLLKEICVDPAVPRKLRMEGGGEDVSLADEDGEAIALGQDFNTGTGGGDARGADEDGFQRTAGKGRFEFEDSGVALVAIGIALDGDVQDAERELAGMTNFFGQQDGAGAGAEDGFLLDERLHGLQEAGADEELKHGGGFTAGHDQAIEVCQALGVADEGGGCASFGEGCGVAFEIALDGQDADAGRGFCCWQVVLLCSGYRML